MCACTEYSALARVSSSTQSIADLPQVHWTFSDLQVSVGARSSRNPRIAGCPTHLFLTILTPPSGGPAQRPSDYDPSHGIFSSGIVDPSSFRELIDCGVNRLLTEHGQR